MDSIKQNSNVQEVKDQKSFGNYVFYFFSIGFPIIMFVWMIWMILSQ